MRYFLAVTLIVIAALPGYAQEQHKHGSHSPYAGMENRPIKSLSVDEIADLQAGHGMSLALAAELNGYPGPRHVLELAGQLALDPEQRQTTERLFEQMQAEAKVLGEKVIAAEVSLDRSFTDKTATSESIARDTAFAASARGSLRASHLRYHLSMLDILTPDQIATYRRLRGYNEK